MDLPNSDDLIVIEWTDAIFTGHEPIDCEHLKLFELMKKLQSTLEDMRSDTTSVATVAKELRDYAALHFSNEEKIMDSFLYVDVEKHKIAHNKFIKKIDVLLIGNEVSVTEAKSYLKFIYEWLVFHICSIDQIMVTELNGGVSGFESYYNEGTSSVINTSIKIANELLALTSHFRTIDDIKKRKQFRSEINSATERLLNLVSLAITRCTHAQYSEVQLKRLKSLRNVLIKSSCHLMDEITKKLMAYCQPILASTTAVPIGCSTKVKRWLASINSIAMLIEDESIISVELAQNIIIAYSQAEHVCAIESRTIDIKEYDRISKEDHFSFDPPPIVSQRICSQEELSAKLT